MLIQRVYHIYIHSVRRAFIANSFLYNSRSNTSPREQSSTLRAMESSSQPLSAPPRELLKPLQLPQRILTGPGPSNCSQRVLGALHQQVLGHMHPEVLEVCVVVVVAAAYFSDFLFPCRARASSSGDCGGVCLVLLYIWVVYY